MHCSPDLVTVLPCWFICSLLLCCWLVGPPPGSAPPCVVTRCAWLTGRQSIQTKFLRKEKEQSEMTIQYTVAVLSPLSVLL